MLHDTQRAIASALHELLSTGSALRDDILAESTVGSTSRSASTASIRGTARTWATCHVARIKAVRDGRLPPHAAAMA